MKWLFEHIERDSVNVCVKKDNDVLREGKHTCYGTHDCNLNIEQYSEDDFVTNTLRQVI